MKRLISLFGFIVVAAIGTFLLLPFVLSTDTIRESIAGQLESWTGRKVTIAGQAQLSVFPTISMRLSGVSVGGPSGGKDTDVLVAMDELDASVRLMPLLRGRVEVDRFALVRPRINLAVDKDGHPNWRLEAGQAGGRAAPQAAPAAAPANAPGATDTPARQPDTARKTSTFAVTAVQIGKFDVRDGQVSYRNAQTGAKIETSSITASMAWPSLTSALTTEGSLVWRGEVVNFSLRFDDPVALATAGASNSEVMVSSSRGSLNMKGIVSTAVDFAVDGSIETRVPSIRALARWFDVDLPAGGGLNELSLKSKFLAGGTKFSFPDAVLALDGNSAEGAIVIKLVSPRPLIQATLATSTLNLTPYLPAPGTASPAAAAPAGKAAGGTVQAPAQAPAGTAPRDTSAADKIDISGLQVIDADLRLSAARTIAGNFEFGSGAVTAALMNGVLTAQLADVKGFGGSIDGTVGIDGRGAVPRLSVNAVAKGVNLQFLLAQAASYGGLSGTANIASNLTASGASRAAMLAGLEGTVQLAATDGAIRGINLVEAIRSLRSGQITGWLAGNGAQTAFSKMSADYQVEKGIARTNNLTIDGPGLSMTGAGHADLTAASLDFRMRARIFDGAKVTPAGDPVAVIDLPIIIRGPWDKPSILPGGFGLDMASPEVEKVIRDVGEKLQDGDLGKIGDAIRKGNINDVLNALTGKK